MKRFIQPSLMRGHNMQRAAIVLAVTLLGVLFGSVIHGIRAL